MLNRFILIILLLSGIMYNVIAKSNIIFYTSLYSVYGLHAGSYLEYLLPVIKKYGDNEAIKHMRAYENKYPFIIRDLSPDQVCTLDGISFIDETDYRKDGDIQYGENTFWIVTAVNAAKTYQVTYTSDRKLNFKDFAETINPQGLVTKYHIGLNVTLKSSDGNIHTYVYTDLATKDMFKTPVVLLRDIGTEDRCITTPKKILQFGRLDPTDVFNAKLSYDGPGVVLEKGNDGTDLYMFDPMKAGPGNKSIIVTATSIVPGNLCSSSAEAKIEVYPTFKINGEEEIIIQSNTPYKVSLNLSIEDESDRKFEYSWDPKIGLSDPNQLNPQVDVVSDIIYKLKVLASSDNMSYPCEVDKNITFRLVPCVDKVKPISNYITPNNDGINDVWVLTNIEKYKDAIVKIYNRSGDLIWSSKGYSSPWKGEYKNGQVIAGTYYYTIDLGINAINTKDKNCPNRYTGFIQVIK